VTATNCRFGYLPNVHGSLIAEILPLGVAWLLGAGHGLLNARRLPLGVPSVTESGKSSAILRKVASDGSK